MNIKDVAKKILGLDLKIKDLETNKEDYSPALEELVNNKPDLKHPNITLSKRSDNEEYSKSIQPILTGWDKVNVELDKYGDPNVKDINEYDGLHSGTPMFYKPFKDIIKKVQKVKYDKTIYRYPATTGTNKAKQDMIEYLYSEGFDKSIEMGTHNVVFTCSTTHAFTIILNTIARPHDVIIMPGPNYGIFALMPDRVNANVEIIDLKEEDKFLINPDSLSKKIDEINKNLKKKYKNKLDYTPKVVAYLNLNPHNPIGNVMSKKDIDLITRLGDVCLEKGVFIIDDLIYRDLTFDLENKAFPIASIKKYFNNTISLFGISKAYALAGFRAGAIICPTPIYWGLSKEIFEYMDSTPVLQVKAMQGVFNGSKKTKRHTQKYLSKLLDEYKYRLAFTTALIYGINGVDNSYKYRIISDIKNIVQDEKLAGKLLTPIPNLEIRKNTYPQSGFFIVLDFTKLKGKIYNGKKINSEFDLLKCFYAKGKVKYLMGENMSWPYKNEFVARAHFALELKALVKNFMIIREVIEGMKDEI